MLSTSEISLTWLFSVSCRYDFRILLNCILFVIFTAFKLFPAGPLLSAKHAA